MPATPGGRLPIYQQIAGALRDQINDGTIARGEKLPTEAELTAEFGVTRATVRDALRTLVNEGLIYSARPQGYFVRHREPMYYRPQGEFRPMPATPEMDRFMTEHAEKGREPSQSIDVAIVQAPAEVAKRLDLDDGEPVVVRRRVRRLDSEPYNINDSYYPRSLVDGTEIMQPGDIARGANEVLAELGHEQVRALDEIYVRMPTPDEARRLDLGPGTPVAYHIATGYTADDRAVRVVLNVLAGDRHVIVYERARPDAVKADVPQG
jgi:GntR family transcriptional regulator